MPAEIAVIEGARRAHRIGGVERYGVWLRGALSARGRLSESGTPYALKAIYGGPNLRTGDGVSAAWVQATGRRRWRWSRHLAKERAALRAAKRVVAISPMVARELAELHGIEAPVVLNPVFRVAPRKPGPRLLFVGHDFRRKGLDQLLTALSLDPSLGLDVVGADRPIRARNVRYLGDVEAAPYIARAALLVHPARYEPYGNVVGEAVACGTPVVASERTGASCLLHADHIWSATEGPAGLTERIHAALRTPRPAIAPPSADAHLAALDAALFG